MKIAHLRRGRQVVQAVSLLVFTLIVVYSTRDTRTTLPSDALLRIDPLAALTASISSRRWLARFVPALVLVFATLVLGRFWCGWLCPLGTVIDWTSLRKARSKRVLSARWRGGKYGLLFVLLFAALWGNLTLMILDPLTIFVRGVSTLVLPGLTWLVTRAEIALYRIKFLRGALDIFDSALRVSVLSYKQPHYASLLLAALVGGILSLNLLEWRAWCRYLCPLGGLLGLISKASWLKRIVSESCLGCGICGPDCRMGTIEADKNYASDSGECILCLDCAAECPKDAISFVGEWGVDRGWPYDPSRRLLLGAFGASVGGLALLKISPRAHHPYPYRLRPPGADEDMLLSSCIRCGTCIRVCPTHGLQPSTTQCGLEGLWTPILVPRLGHCEYSCTACGDICPTEAIPRLSQPAKLASPIGKAYIDPAICIAWSGRSDCIVCEEMCPLSEKAIILEERRTTDPDSGATRIRQAPVVVHERCIGCGLCENKCPVNGEAAIRVIVDPMG